MIRSLLLTLLMLVTLDAYAVNSLNQNLSSESSSTAKATPSTSNSNQPSPQTLNKIVAYVNKRIITSNELDAQVMQTQAKMPNANNLSASDLKDLRNKVLDQLILKQIQLDLAARAGIKVSDSDVNDAIALVEKNQKMNDAQMRQSLIKQGISYDTFRQQISDQVTIQKLQQREVDGRIIVNDDEVTRILNSETYKNRIDYHLADIVIGTPEQATQDIIAQKQDLANQVYAQLQNGASFEQMALKYSTAPNALNGGDIGWKSNTSLPPMILNQLTTLNANGTTQVIKFPVGFMIFKVLGVKRHGTPQIVHQYHVRHILIKVNELTSEDEAHQKIQSIYNQLLQYKNNPDQESREFIELAKQYSNDTSAISGGDIGWISKGDTVPQFEEAVLATPVGQISKPIRSPFGWHIIQVIATRDSNLANDREKNEIRQEIRESKAQMMYFEWIRSLRDMAYVKINDD